MLTYTDADGVKKTPYGEVDVDTQLVDLPGIDAKDGVIAGPAGIADMPNYIAEAAGKSKAAVDGLQAAKDNIEDFNKAVDAYNKAVAAEADLEEAADNVKATAEAVTEAEEAFDDLGFNLVKAEDGVADGTAFDENAEDQDADLFVYGESKLTVENFDGNDVLYFGDKAADLIVVTKAQADSAAGKLGGEANVLEIFAYQDGANTVLYVEKEAFAGGSNNAIDSNKDLVTITLTGVQADELQLSTDGFLGFMG